MGYFSLTLTLSVESFESRCGGPCRETPHPGQAWAWMPSVTAGAHVCLAHQVPSGQLLPLWVLLSALSDSDLPYFPASSSRPVSLAPTRDQTSSCPRTGDRIGILKTGFFWEAWASRLLCPRSLYRFLTLLIPRDPGSCWAVVISAVRASPWGLSHKWVSCWNPRGSGLGHQPSAGWTERDTLVQSLFPSERK